MRESDGIKSAGCVKSVLLLDFCRVWLGYCWRDDDVKMQGDLVGKLGFEGALYALKDQYAIESA